MGNQQNPLHMILFSPISDDDSYMNFTMVVPARFHHINLFFLQKSIDFFLKYVRI